MSQIHLGSCSKVKVDALIHHFDNVVTHKVNSGVSNQPVGDNEIRRGAYNRLENLQLPAISLETGFFCFIK